MGSPTFEEIFSCVCERLSAANQVQEISKQFANTTSDAERVAIAYKHVASLAMFPSRAASTKSSTTSCDLRQRGNREFSSKANTEALTLYTESIATAPWPDDVVDAEELALAFANRSAVFFATRRHHACLADIQQALELNYPDALKYKVLERRAKCFQQLGRLEEAKQAFQEALASALPADKAVQIRSTLLQLETETPCAVTSDVHDEHLPRLTFDANPEVPCASDAVTIKYSAELGRYIASSRDVLPGDVLLVETAYASVLLPQHRLSHCHYCLRRHAALLPCRHCALAMYCSEKCRSASWSLSHRLECDVIPALQLLDTGKVSLLALRVLVVASSSGRDLPSLVADIHALEQRTQDPRTRGFTDNVYSSLSFNAVHCLVGNTDTRSVSDLYKRATKAAVMLSLVESTSEFCGVDGDVKLVVGGLLLRLLQSLPCNAHSVTDHVAGDGKSVTESAEIACAVYATLSLFNHSCDPNVTRSNHRGDVAVLRAVRPIKAGEQMLDNYGYHYAVQDRAGRQSGLLGQYHFTCECEACANHWPTYHRLPTANPAVLCTACRAVLPPSPVDVVLCTACHQENNIALVEDTLRRVLQSFNQIYECLLSGQGHGFTRELSEHLVLLDRTVRRPWRLYNDCQEALKECFMRSGNFYVT